jgi:hypothetical protein
MQRIRFGSSENQNIPSVQRNQSQNNNMATPDADQAQGRCQNMSNIEIPATGATTGSYPVRNSASALAISPPNGDAQLSQATKDLSSISLVTLDLAKPMSVINTDNETATRVTDSAHHTENSTSESSSDFDKLPAEIREKIFKRLLARCSGSTPALVCPARCNKKLCPEVISTYYKANTFTLERMNVWQLRGFSRTAMANIQNVATIVNGS